MILHSQILGEGTPFVILHGFMGMSDNWKTLGNTFADNGYQVHLVDQRNHGRSFHDDTFNYDVMAEDLLAYLLHHQLDSVILLGHSMGGKTAMQFAIKYPERINKLLIADIGPKEYPQHHQDILKALATLDFNTLKTRGEADDALSKYIKDMGTRQFLLKNLYWVSKGKLGLRVNLPIVTLKISEIGKALPQEAIYNGDTLFLKGSKSGYIEEMDAMIIKKHFPNSEIKTVSDAGHWLHAENPSEFYQIVMNFL